MTIRSIRNHTDNSSNLFHNVVAFLIYQGGVLFERIYLNLIPLYQILNPSSKGE